MSALLRRLRGEPAPRRRPSTLTLRLRAQREQERAEAAAAVVARARRRALEAATAEPAPRPPGPLGALVDAFDRLATAAAKERHAHERGSFEDGRELGRAEAYRNAAARLANILDPGAAE